MSILDLLALTCLDHEQHDLPMGDAEWRAWKSGRLHDPAMPHIVPATTREPEAGCDRSGACTYVEHIGWTCPYDCSSSATRDEVADAAA